MIPPGRAGPAAREIPPRRCNALGGGPGCGHPGHSSIDNFFEKILKKIKIKLCIVFYIDPYSKLGVKIFKS